MSKTLSLNKSTSPESIIIPHAWVTPLREGKGSDNCFKWTESYWAPLSWVRRHQQLLILSIAWQALAIIPTKAKFIYTVGMSAVLEWVILYTWTHKLLTHIERVKCSERKTSSSSSYVSFHILHLYLSFFHHCLIYCYICFHVFIFLFLVLLSPHSCFLQCFSTTITFTTSTTPPPLLLLRPSIDRLTLALYHVFPFSVSFHWCCSTFGHPSQYQGFYIFFLSLLFTCIASVRGPCEVGGYWFLQTTPYNTLSQ